MLTDDGKHLYVSWDEYHLLIERLALKVHGSGWEFDQILCLARGGLRPGDVLSRVEFERRYAAMPLLKKAELIDENGAAHPVPLTGGCSVDAFGNWRFADRGATVAAASLPPAAMRRLRLRGEYLLLGIESLIAGTAPPPRPTGFDTWLTKVKQQVAKVPGATAAWQLVRGKPRR